MNPDDLADLLANRLQGIVPPGFHVEAADGMLWYWADAGRFPGQQGDYNVGRSGTYIRNNFPLHGDSLEDHIVGVSREALDELQDYVDEASHDPWPGHTRPPAPQAEIRGDRLYLWFVDDQTVVAECEPIPLDRD